MTTDMASKAVNQMATAATTLRDAIAAALPVSATQLMTVQVPGTVIDPTEFMWDPSANAFIPLDVRIAEAKLVDNQVPISKIMMGRTGKSVARSYLTALDVLISVESSIASALAGDKPLTDRQQKIRDRYQNAMKYLTSKDDASGKSRLKIYVEKQEAWNQAVETYNSAQYAQQKLDQDNKLTVNEQRQSFLQWMQTHGRDYKATIQAKYMDWVVHGFKFDVEFNFGVVDVSSAMKRVESSKEAFRNLTLLAADGASEYSGVNLTPRNWATLVKETMDGWATRNRGPSPLEIRAEIKRLRNLEISHHALKASVDSGKFKPLVYKTAEGSSDETLATSYQASYEAVGAKSESNAGDKKNIEFASLFKDTSSKYKDWNTTNIKQNNAVMSAQSNEAKTETSAYLEKRIKAIQQEIQTLEMRLQATSAHANAPGTVVKPTVVDHAGNMIDDSETKANVDLLKDLTVEEKPSPWTRITAKVSSSASESIKVSSESATSGGAGAGSWWWGVSASASHTSSSMSASSDISNLDVEIAMDCMLVEIERPWLHAELFADYELDAAPGFKISPGPQALQKAAEEHKVIDTDYTQFCSYPNAFVLASNVELSFNGDTSHLESSLEASSTQANVSVGWGPFSISSSHKSSKSSSRTKSESTANGMHISLQAPQIIAWVSELLPALPKPEGRNPALFGLPLEKPGLVTAATTTGQAVTTAPATTTK
ncbi:hypothetical protein F66182_6426 [Fusarium sp. NRRL 66182]|nr:hypothetical protein F66182_6426 [Fusarium sp. NRRL 66182]